MLELRKKIFFGIFESKFGFASQNIKTLSNALIIQSDAASSSIQVFFHILQSLVILVGLFILGVLISWKIFLIATAITFIAFLLLQVTVRISHKLGKDMALTNEEYLGNIQEAFRNYKYLKSTSVYSNFFTSLTPLLKRVFRIQMIYGLMKQGTQIITEPLIIISLLDPFNNGASLSTSKAVYQL